MLEERNGKADSQITKNKSEDKPLSKFNIILAILIVISLIFLIYRLNLIPFDDNKPPDEPNGKKSISIIPLREAGIINGHEHIQNPDQAGKWLGAMDRAGVSTTVMLGSPDATYYLNPEGPFNKYNKSNEELLELVEKYPDRFIAFPTLYTFDTNKTEQLKDYIDRGALGLKLFTGHHAVFYEHIGPLNHTTMYPVYEYCESEGVPIIWHVHLGKEYLQKEFAEVLADFPNLIINVPHFMLSSIDLWQSDGQGRLRYYLETYPNLYTDISFGFWVKDGLWRMSNHTAIFREFMIEFQDRFTFGTDMVCTNQARKDVTWIANLTIGYRDILEKEYFNLTVIPDIMGDFNGDDPGTHSGLNLPQDVLDKIYYDNMVKFLNCKPYYEDLEDVIKDSKLTYQKEGETRNGDQENDLSFDQSESIRSSEQSILTLSSFSLFSTSGYLGVTLFALPISKRGIKG